MQTIIPVADTVTITASMPLDWRGYVSKSLASLLEPISEEAKWREYVSAKFNPNHVPAGSPEGGQFASSDEGGGVPIGKTTEDLHRDPLTGKWDSERAALHDKIINKFLEGKTPPVGRPPELTMLGGGAASGKSTILKGVDTSNTVVVNPDTIRPELPEFAKLLADQTPHGMSAATTTHEEASYLAKEILGKSMARGLDTIYDSTGSGGNTATIASRFAGDGYKVNLAYTDVAIDVAMARADARAMNPNSADFGRFIPEAVMQGTHIGAATNFMALKDSLSVHSAKLYNNNGKAPVLIYSRVGNRPAEVHDAAEFAKYRAKAN